MGLIFAEIGKYGRAEELYRKAIESNPANYQAHNNLGYVLLVGNMYSEAAEHFKAALRINPAFSEAKKNLEFVLSKQ